MAIDAVNLVFDEHEDVEPVPREVVHALHRLQTAILRHPIVMQAAFSALAAEGRRYADTAEGACLRDALMRSRDVARARMIWEALSMKSFVEKPDSALPSAFIEHLVKAIAVDKLEPLLSRVLERRRL